MLRIIAISVLLLSQVSQAELYQLHYQGSLDEVYDAVNINVGDSWSVDVFFDSAREADKTGVFDGSGDDPRLISGSFSEYNVGLSTITIAGEEYAAGTVIFVANDIEFLIEGGPHRFFDFLQIRFLQPDLEIESLPFSFSNLESQAEFSTTELSEVVAANDHSGQLTVVAGDDARNIFLRGSSSSMSVSEVPVPAAAWFLASALLTLLGFKRNNSLMSLG